MTDRPSWDETWMSAADALALRSRCCRAQVGAVIVTADNRIGSASYNGPARGDVVTGDCSTWCPRAMNSDSSPSYDSCRAIHAEANAVARSDWSQIQGATIYITGSMCINCAKLVANSGIHRIVHRVLPEHEYRNPELVEEYLWSVGIEVVRSPV